MPCIWRSGPDWGDRVLGRWPGLDEAEHCVQRDWAAQVMQGLYGLDRGLLERTVFPSLLPCDLAPPGRLGIALRVGFGGGLWAEYMGMR